MQSTFSAAIARAPIKPFQWLVLVFALLVLVIEGIDLQSLSLVTPVILDEWGIDRALFGPPLAGAMFGMAFGSSFGGILGDRVGRLAMLFAAAIIFGISTILAAYTNDVVQMTAVRVLGGVGFGAAYPNAMALASDWVPERFRTYAIAALSVGIPVGTALSALIVPELLHGNGWRGTFLIFGVGSVIFGFLLILLIRESPPFLLANGKQEAAQKAAAKVLDGDFELLPEPPPPLQQEGERIGVFHPFNRRLNWGMGISLSAGLTYAYGILSWTPEFLTSSGFTLDQALDATFMLGIWGVIGGASAGYFTRTFGSKAVTIACAVLGVLVTVALGLTIDNMSELPSANERLLATVLVAAAGFIMSLVVACYYAMMVAGYPQSCRSGGMGAMLTIARFGGIAMVTSGGWLLNLAGDSFIAYFAVLTFIAAAFVAAAMIVDRQIPPARVGEE
jgi:AAHS family 4-hydroxybenzoate transporter-like MFS transporter